MAIRVIREVNRSEGKSPKTGVDIIAGMPLLFEAGTVKPYDDSGFHNTPYGLAAETTVQFPIAPTSGLTAGEGFDYTNFARGGLVSAFINGGEFDLFDDGRGAPYQTGDTYTINHSVYVGDDGLITSTNGGNSDPHTHNRVGVVVDFEGSSPVTRLRIKSLL